MKAATDNNKAITDHKQYSRQINSNSAKCLAIGFTQSISWLVGFIRSVPIRIFHEFFMQPYEELICRGTAIVSHKVKDLHIWAQFGDATKRHHYCGCSGNNVVNGWIHWHLCQVYFTSWCRQSKLSLHLRDRVIFT